jgi:Archaeal fructose-1,6-bisphosphatase and related enzymes of inositol monophosphatase family
MGALTAEVDALRAVAAAGAAVAHDGFRGQLEIEQKGGETDLVTHIDRAAQTAVVEAIQTRFTDAHIVGEEGMLPKQLPARGTAWVVDPIDGTHNFIRGRRLFATAVGLVVDGEPRAGTSAFPAMGDVYHTDGETVWRNDAVVRVSDVTDPHQAIIAHCCGGSMMTVTGMRHWWRRWCGSSQTSAASEQHRLCSHRSPRGRSMARWPRRGGTLGTPSAVSRWCGPQAAR